MLFRKKIEKSCEYCSFGVQTKGGQIVCSKKGIVDGDNPCRKFRYDPLKRVPVRKKPVDFSKYDEEDFSL